MQPTAADSEARGPIAPGSVLVVRPGHGANCSSIGSVVDTLFVTALVGGALFAAVVGSLGKEPVEVVGGEELAEGAKKAPDDEDSP